MENVSIPAGYQRVMPYLIVEDAEGFLAFTQKVFGASEKVKVMNGDRIMHAEIDLGDSTIMFANSTNAFTVQTAGLFVYVANADETYNKALESGATAITPISNQSYGRSGGIKDPFGIVWWITTNI